ncbi:MAG: hypothetical protein WCT25_02665 [Candidatus Paceibacterota bacterium]
MSDEQTQTPTDTSIPPPEPEVVTPSSEMAPPEIAPEVGAPSGTLAPEGPSGAVGGSGESGNLEGVKDIISSSDLPVGQPLAEVASAPPTSEAAGPAPEVSAPVSVPISGQNAALINRGNLPKAWAKIQETKSRKLEKIMAALDGKVPTTLKLRGAGKISNDEAEKLLRVSDATATRYLEVLERENRIRQVGKIGQGVFYEKI